MTMHVFFDTTEVVADKTCLPRLGRIANPKLHSAASAIGATLYLPDLALDEVVYRRWRRLMERVEVIKEAASEIRGYAAASLGDPPDEKATIALFREEVRGALAQFPIVLVPSAQVPLTPIRK